MHCCHISYEKSDRSSEACRVSNSRGDDTVYATCTSAVCISQERGTQIPQNLKRQARSQMSRALEEIWSIQSTLSLWNGIYFFLHSLHSLGQGPKASLKIFRSQLHGNQCYLFDAIFMIGYWADGLKNMSTSRIGMLAERNNALPLRRSVVVLQKNKNVNKAWGRFLCMHCCELHCKIQVGKRQNTS